MHDHFFHDLRSDQIVLLKNEPDPDQIISQKNDQPDQFSDLDQINFQIIHNITKYFFLNVEHSIETDFQFQFTKKKFIYQNKVEIDVKN